MISTNDPISDFLTRIRNAALAKHKSLRVPRSKMLERIATILHEEGYIADTEFTEDGVRGEIVMHLRYLQDRSHAITKLRRISKPSRRRYVNAGEIPRVKNGLGIAIMSTSKGVMTGYNARRNNVGGEVLCTIW